eukprot:SAG31_NODE_22688_length_520_cov_0.817102_1_plen_36_part_10
MSAASGFQAAVNPPLAVPALTQPDGHLRMTTTNGLA